MTIQINGTSGISGVDGSATTPALQGTDTNTGISFGTDEVNVVTGGSTRATVDSSGNLKVGAGTTVTPDANADDLVIDKGAADTGLSILSTTTGRIYFGDAANDEAGSIRYVHSDDSFRHYSNSAERLRLTSNGVNYVWNNGNSTALISSSSVGSGTTVVFAVRHSASSITGGTDAYYIRANGSAGAASDVNLKKNIETTRDGYLEDLNRLRVVKYNWNDQEDTEPRELGLIAQEVEEVFPGLVCDMNGEDENGEKTAHKGIVYSVLPVMLLKALQEADAKIESQATQIASQAATIAALDARLTALEGGAS